MAKGRDKVTQALRNTAMIQEATQGVSSKEIAQKYNLSETQVSNILNHSDEARIVRYKLEKAFQQRIDKILDALDRSLAGEDQNLHVAASSAFKLIERLAGKVPDKVEAKVEAVQNLTEDELIAKAEQKLAELKARRGIT